MKALIMLLGLTLVACSKTGFFSEEKKTKVPTETTDGTADGAADGVDGSADGVDGSADGGDGSADGGDGSADGGDGSADGVDGSADGGDGSADGGDGSTDGGDGSADGGDGSADGGDGSADGGDGSADGGDGSADGGDGSADGGDGEHQCESEKEIIDLCANTEQTVLEAMLFYEERIECSFAPGSSLALTTHHDDDCNYSDEGNLCAKDHHLQAQAIQSRSITLPQNAVLCSLEIESTSQEIQYDDFLIFTLNDYLLMLSNDDLLRKMPKKDGLYVWDFEHIKGRKYGFDGDRHCLGDNSNCMLPGHDEPGPVNFSIDTQSLVTLADKAQGNESYRFDVIATGDNDRGDCWHTDLNLKVKVRYAIKPE